MKTYSKISVGATPQEAAADLLAAATLPDVGCTHTAWFGDGWQTQRLLTVFWRVVNGEAQCCVAGNPDVAGSSEYAAAVANMSDRRVVTLGALHEETIANYCNAAKQWIAAL